MLAACYGNARVNISVNTVFVIARSDLDFFLFFLKRNNTNAQIIDYIAVGHIRTPRPVPSRITEIVFFKEHRQRQIFMRKRTHFIDKVAARLHIVECRLGSCHRCPDAVVSDIHDRLDHQLIVAVGELIVLNPNMTGYSANNLFVREVAAYCLNACSRAITDNRW